MGRPKRLYPLGRYRLRIRGEVDPNKQYLIELEYTWGKSAYRKGVNLFAKYIDWNPDANQGRGGVRPSYGPEAKRVNALLMSRVDKVDSNLAEYHQKHPGEITPEVINDFLNDKPVTREDKGKDFVELALERPSSKVLSMFFGRVIKSYLRDNPKGNVFSFLYGIFGDEFRFEFQEAMQSCTPVEEYKTTVKDNQESSTNSPRNNQQTSTQSKSQAQPKKRISFDWKKFNENVIRPWKQFNGWTFTSIVLLIVTIYFLFQIL